MNPQAEAFLAMLASPDGRELGMGLPQDGCGTAPPHAEGCPSDLLQLFEGWSLGGLSPCVMLQRSVDRTGRGVCRARVLFVDVDRDSLGTIPLPPTMRVKTRSGWHLLWKIEPTADLAGWRVAQRALCALLDGDPAASDLGRKVRVPGYPNNKTDPGFVHRIVEHEPERVYRLEEVLAFLVIDPQQRDEAFSEARSEGGALAVPGFSLSPSYLRRKVDKAVTRVRYAEVGKRWHTLRAQAFHVGCYVPLGLDFPQARARLLGVARAWTDEDQSKLRRLVDDMGLNGERRGREHPQRMPKVERARMETAQGRWLLREALLAAPLPPQTTVEETLKLAGAAGASLSPAQRRRVAGAVLRELGYGSRVVKRGGKATRVYRLAAAGAPGVEAHAEGSGRRRQPSNSVLTYSTDNPGGVLGEGSVTSPRSRPLPDHGGGLEERAA